jgi:hypothetical protein
LFDYVKNSMGTDLVAFATNCYNNAVDAYANAVIAGQQAAQAAASKAASDANAIAAAAAAGATIWVSGSTYAIGDVRYSPANKRIYRRTTAGAGAADPSADATNWSVVAAWFPITHISTTTATATAGSILSLENAAATAVTLGTLADNDEFSLILTNGRADNTFDIGTKTLYGNNGQSVTGVITLDSQVRVWKFKYTTATTSLEVI